MLLFCNGCKVVKRGKEIVATCWTKVWGSSSLSLSPYVTTVVSMQGNMKADLWELTLESCACLGTKSLRLYLLNKKAVLTLVSDTARR